MIANLNKESIYSIWQSLREHGKYKDITISKEIRESWERSKIYGVDPTKPYCDVVLNRAELEERRANNHVLVEEAQAMMEHLQEFTEGSGFLYTLTDREGYCLISIGDRDAVNFTAVAKLTEGANWSEEVMGTNSNSLAMALRKPIQIFGYEHYCRVNAGATCSAAPIFDEDGNIIGVFNIAGPYRLVNRHTLGMAVATARNIERQLALYHIYQQSEMANLHKTAIMNSMSDGVLTLDHESRVTHLNVPAAQSLGIDYHNAIGQSLSDLMFPNNELFLSKLSNYKTISGENLVVKRKNDMIKLAVNCTPLIGKNNQILGTVVVLTPMQKYKHLIQRVAGSRSNITFDQIIGKSGNFKNAINYAQMAVDSDSNVLLLGESGVGKEMFAQAIHNAGNRSQELFLAINCAALPRELISSELFGYEDGAFTGARKGGNPGKFELADQGTIFLDEIGEMPLDMQASLLRVLESGTIERLGGRELIPVNVRIIAATNKKLLEEVKKGNFRLDLYYRLGVMIINIPPLRERSGDVPELVEHFIKTIGPRHGKNITGIDNRAMDILLNYDWPGNVRELNNVIERAINICSENVLTADMLPPEMYEDSQEYIRIWEETPSIDIMEEQLIRNYLNKFSNNRSKVAKELGISRSSLYRKMAKFSIY